MQQQWKHKCCNAAMVNLTTFHIQKCINSWGCGCLWLFTLYTLGPTPTWAKLHCTNHVQASNGGNVACSARKPQYTVPTMMHPCQTMPTLSKLFKHIQFMQWYNAYKCTHILHIGMHMFYHTTKHTSTSQTPLHAGGQHLPLSSAYQGEGDVRCRP